MIEITFQDVRILNEISQIVGGPEALTPPKVELISLLSTTNGPSPPSEEDAEVVAKMVNDILSSQSQGKFIHIQK